MSELAELQTLPILTTGVRSFISHPCKTTRLKLFSVSLKNKFLLTKYGSAYRLS